MMNGVLMGWMWIWPVLVAAGLAAMIAAAVLWTRGRPSPPETTWRAKQILDERYARGEINAEEYRRMRAHLQ